MNKQNLVLKEFVDLIRHG